MKYTKEFDEALNLLDEGSISLQVDGGEVLTLIDIIGILRSEISRLQQASRWIPVSERRPTVDDCRKDSDGNLIPFVMGCINGTLYGLIHIHHFAINDYYTDWQPIQPLPTPPEGE